MRNSLRTGFTILLLFVVAFALMAAGGTEQTTSAAAPEAIDLGGRTIKLASYYNFEGYFKDGNGRGKLEEIGEKFKLTRERVRQIKEKAIKRLRHASRSKPLKAYLT